MSKRHRVPVNAENVTVGPYRREPCCCGDPDCRDFEDRMAAQGIPLDEITVTTYTVRLT